MGAFWTDSKIAELADLYQAKTAACSIKAARERLRAQALKGNTDEELVAEKLEAIYYAIGGTAEAWNHSSENASPD